MSSKASIRTLAPGTKLAYTNDTHKPLALVMQSQGTSVRITLAIGQSIDFDVGHASVTLYLLEPEASENGLELVRKPEPAGSTERY